MLRLVIIVCVLKGYLSVTDLTLSNCPSQFNVTLANTTDTNSAQFRNFFYSAFSSDGNKARVETIVIHGNAEGDLSTYLVELSYPYIAIGVASLVMYVTMICCCVFEKSCPPCQSWRRDFIRRPYQKSQLRCVMIFALIFAVIIMGASIYCFTVIPNAKRDMEYTKCSIYLTLDTTVNGDTSKNWGGFLKLKNQIGNISSLLSSTSTQINTYLPGDQWLVDNMVVMKKANLEIYKQYQNSKLITPDPVATASTASGSSLPVIDSVFIKTGMGPNGTFNTMVDDLDKGLRTTQTLSSQAYAIDKSSKQVVQSQTTIQANTAASQITMSMYLNQLNATIFILNNFSNTVFTGVFSWGLYVLEGSIGFILAGSLLIILGIVSTHFFDILQCRSMVHLGWVIYGISHLFVIVLVYIFLSVGSMGHQSCNYFNLMLTNETEYKRLGDYSSQNILNRIKPCIFGDGNVLQSFDLAQQMKTVTDLFTNIVTYYDYEDSSSANFVDKTISTTKLNGWISAIENYKLGIYKDSNDLQTSSINPNYAIGQLNLYTYQGGGVPTCSKDRWVYDAVNCTNPAETTYVSQPSQANGLALSSINVICISFNQKLTNTRSTPWTQSDFRKRYIQIKEDCPGAYDKIISFGESIINFRDSRINLYSGIKDDLNALLALNNNFNTLLSGFRGRVNQFYSSVSTLNNLVTNNIDGLLVSSDCRVLKSNMLFSYNSFCVNFMERAASLGIASLVLVVVMVGGTLTANVFAVRYARVQRDKRINALIDASEVSDDFHRRQVQKSEQTSSSDQD